MIENPLMNFLTKSAYTPWINNDLPEITNSNSWENFSYDPEVLARHKYNAELNAQQLAAAEAANTAGKQKLLRFYETGEGYEPWMDPHIASHFGVKAEDLKDPRVLNRIYKRFKGAPHKVLQGLGQESSAPAMGPTGVPWNPGGSALNSNYRDAILKRIENYAAQKANDFTNAANSSLNELGQYGSAEDTSTPDLSIEDPGLIEEQINSTPPVVNTRVPEVPISSPVVNPVLYPVDKTDYTNRLNEAQNQLSQKRVAFNPGPSLPNSALTAAGGADVSFQAPAIDIPEFNPAPKPAPASPAAQATQNPFTAINVADYNKPYGLDDARAIVAQGLDGKSAAPTVTGATNATAPAATPSAAPVQQEVPESAGEVAPQSKSTAVKNPLISIEQARELLAKGIAPTSIGGYHQTLGSDGTNPQAQQELELMDKDPTYNPFANTQAKYVQKLNRMRLSDQYNPEVIRAESQRIQQNQAKLDADRRSRMNAARYYAGQGVQGARDYHNYMTRGGQLSQAGQQWRDNFNVAGWNQQQSQAQRQQAQPQQTQWKSVLDGPRDPGEQAYMRSVLGYADTGSGVGSHAAGRTWAAKNNSSNGLSTPAAKPVKNPITQPK